MTVSNDLPLDSAHVSALLREFGIRLELAGEVPFKTRAYSVAADSLSTLPGPLAEFIAQGRLRTLTGVGESLAEKILKLHKTGTHPTLEFLRAQIPAGILELLKVQGLGPKKAAILFQELQIDSLAALENACLKNKLLEFKGFGAKVQAAFLRSIEQLKATAHQCLIDEAAARASSARGELIKHFPKLTEAHVAGEARRGCEISSKTALAVSCSKPAEFKRLTEYAAANEITLFAAPPERFGAALLFATGSSAHLEQLSAVAASKGFTLSADGLAASGKPLSCDTEAALYSSLGLQFIEPELREGLGEVDLAVRRALPKLLREADLRGILHCHTHFSDGTNSLAEMAEGARALGAQYFGVCDHSQSAAYAGGLKIEKVRAQRAQADALNAQYSSSANFRIFKGIESDILQDGALDYPDAQLGEFDFIVASVHSRFQLPKKEQTARLVKAASNPFTTILGHPTGRLLLKREPYDVDLDAVLAACAKHGVAVEINAHPHRLDLDWRWHARALELGCLFAINPDAHDVPELQLQKWGVSVARKGGIPPERVLNCLDLAAITAHFAERKKSALAAGL